VPFGAARELDRRAHENGGRMIELLIADVDGTLVTHEKELTERARRAVRKLHDASIAFAVTSGRPPRGMSMLVAPLALTTPIAGFNGGMFVHPDMTPIEIKALPAEIVPRIVRVIEEHRLDVWIYQGSQWLLRKLDAPHVAREQWTVRFAPTVARDLSRLTADVVKIVGVSDDLPAVEGCERDLREQCGDHVSAARSQPYYVDVTHPAANKGEVVAYLSQKLAIPAEKIATIGDMPNDVLMFARSGLSIAMGNASPDMQRAARHVTGSNDRDGFADAVERFVLGKR
jgi:Cof subfamily protein (haloacid dehalogenase superfamily)